jgi:hypothetical protein
MSTVHIGVLSLVLLLVLLFLRMPIAISMIVIGITGTLT